MAVNRRLLENGVDLRLLEDASGFRLLEDGPDVAGGQIPFPGGYGYGSGGYGGGGAGAGGGGLSGGGQGGTGSGGGAGTGTTTVVPLPFKPGLILFIMSNQTLPGWRAYASGEFRWTCTGMAAWAAADKSSIFNCSHATHYTATPGAGAVYGSGQYDGHCIWVRENATTDVGDVTALAHVSAITDDGFEIFWDEVAGAGYPIYFVAARDQTAWADFTATGIATVDGLTGGSPAQDNRPQGGLSFFHGYNAFPNGTPTNNFLASSVSQWARPDRGENFDPAVGGVSHASINTYEQAFGINDDSAGHFDDLPGDLHGLVMSPWIAGSILQGMSSLYLINGQAQVVFQSNNPQGFIWATGARDSCDARQIFPLATLGEASHELRYDFVNESKLRAQIGLTYSVPSKEIEDFDGDTIGHAVGIWARQIDDDPSRDFHATVAAGKDLTSGRLVSYYGADFSWLGQFSIETPGAVAAGRLKYEQPGEIVTVTDETKPGGELFHLWLNGIRRGAWLPHIYRRD